MSALDVVHCDNHLLVVRKPAGMAVVPDASGDASLLEQARAWIAREFAKPGAAFLGVVHRLDRPVSGLVVFARTSKAAARLSAQWREHAVEKIYWGVGAGAPRESAGELEEHLSKDEERNVVAGVPPETPGARAARTRWRVLERREGRTLFEFQPLTGRPHQLRHCARRLGTPLLGDLKYGAERALPDASIALHAARLRVRHPTRSIQFTFAARPPEGPAWSFEHVLGWNEAAVVVAPDEPV
ncbi:MAG: RNA pseudouridine synthase [Planctomycetes bacterium]|nr:RNA pseudouridine synthase [Planctomycetota bacterium]